MDDDDYSDDEMMGLYDDPADGELADDFDDVEFNNDEEEDREDEDIDDGDQEDKDPDNDNTDQGVGSSTGCSGVRLADRTAQAVTATRAEGRATTVHCPPGEVIAAGGRSRCGVAHCRRHGERGYQEQDQQPQQDLAGEVHVHGFLLLPGA
jgi:hypothetical protein